MIKLSKIEANGDKHFTNYLHH